MGSRVRFSTNLVTTAENTATVLQNVEITATADYTLYSKEQLTIPEGGVWQQSDIFFRPQPINFVLLPTITTITATVLRTDNPIECRINLEGDPFQIDSALMLIGGLQTLQFRNTLNPTATIDIELYAELGNSSATSPYLLIEQESGCEISNADGTSQLFLKLPPIRRGLQYSFVVANSTGIRISCRTNSIINNYGGQSSEGGYAESFDVGSMLTLVAISDSVWGVSNGAGVWVLN